MINYKHFYNQQEIVGGDIISKYPSISTEIFFLKRKKLFLKNYQKMKKNNAKLNILDIGCGTGRNLFSIYEVAQKQDYFLGVDISEEDINFCEKYCKIKGYKNIKFMVIDISKELKNITQKFDLIIFSEVIEHLYPKDQVKCLKDISEILSDDGIVIITCPNKDNLIKKVLKKMKKVPLIKNMVNVPLTGSVGHIGEMSYKELYKKCSVNFEVIKQGGLTFSYGNSLLDKSMIRLSLYDFLNCFFSKFAPSKCFDQYIILKKKSLK